MKMLLIGGSGILGSAIAATASEQGYDVTSIATECGAQYPSKAKFVQARTGSSEFESVIENIVDEERKWDIVVDVIGSDGEDALRTYRIFKNRCDRLFAISTTLVYDRLTKFTYSPIQTGHPLASPGRQGGYVDKKLSMERFWQEHPDVRWTILRPYHILGPGSWLGCIPPHNRDPQLVEELQKEHMLILSDGGRIPLNVVHPKDIGELILRAAKREATIHKCYNAVNPTEVIARDYYGEIAQQLGRSIRIHSETSERTAWYFSREWQLTTLPHIYDVSDLEKDIAFVPSIPLRDCIRDSLQNQPIDRPQRRQTEVHKRMNVEPLPSTPNTYRDYYHE